MAGTRQSCVVRFFLDLELGWSRRPVSCSHSTHLLCHRFVGRGWREYFGHREGYKQWRSS